MKYDNDRARSPVFSIITPVFNGEAYIRETINSVLDAARGFPFEYLVIDDGSTDDTFQILLEFSNSIKVIRQQNSGEATAVNRGLKESTGALVLIVSDDDPLFGDQIFVGAEDFFKRNHHVVAWYPNWRKIDFRGNLIEEIVPLDFSMERVLGLGMCLPGPGTIFHADAARNIDFRTVKLKFNSDYDFWLRLSQIGTIVHRNQLVAQWRQHVDSTSMALRGGAMGEERIEVIDSFIEKYEVDAKLAQTARASSHYFAAALGVFDKSVKSRELIIKSVLISRGLPKVAKLRVVFFSLLHPSSFYATKLLSRLSKKFRDELNSL